MYKMSKSSQGDSDTSVGEYEVVVYNTGRIGNHKNDLVLWRGCKVMHGHPVYVIATIIISLFARDGAQVILRNRERWLFRATLKDGKFTEEVHI